MTSDSEGVALGNLQAIIREARQKLREAQVRGLGYIVRRHRTEALAVRDFRPPIPPEIAAYAARLIALLEEADTEEPQRVADYEALIFKLDD